jgi:pimeloyl-ACP methyl ester carboxylesterase
VATVALAGGRRASYEVVGTGKPTLMFPGKAWEGGLYQGIDLRPLLARISCPTLVIAGELDFISGPAQATPIASAIRDARLHVIPDCGHSPGIEARVEYRATVLEFLAES